MRALVFHPTIPRFVLTRALRAVRRSAAWGPWAPLQYREVAEPPLPGEEWVRVQVRLGGICGSDLHTIQLDSSPALSALTSFPFVLGHENVGTVAEVGRRAEGLSVGQRVTVEPALPCAARGVSACPYCAAGRYNLCVRVTDGHLSPGLMIGACRDTGGSWSACFVAHRSQVFAVPDDVPDDEALMAEPAACAVHPLLASPPADRDTVLVIGGGVIGLCAIAALRALGSAARVIALVKYPHQEDAARRLGADVVVRVGRGDAHYPEVADLVGAVLRRPMLGKRVVLGGADLTVECVGSARSLDDALRLTRPGGAVIVLGLAGVPAGVDWTPVWWKELRVTGSYIYGVETWQGRQVRTIPLVLEWMAAGRLRLRHLVTHRFALRDYPAALEAATGKAGSRAFKVVFTP
jgi:threonine dehydrogenase-like Zn-dependent dehydrogenase